MKSPFRKLIRISVVLLVLVLLFNFFGYYINRIRSGENREVIVAINRRGYQQALCQRIAKESILLLSNPERTTAAAIRDTLTRLIASFQENQVLLQKQASATPSPVPQLIFQNKLLLNTSQTFFEPINAIGQELMQSDSTLIAVNRKMYLRDLLYTSKSITR